MQYFLGMIYSFNSLQLAASTRTKVMPVRGLGSDGKSSLRYVVIAKSTKKTSQIIKTVLGKTNIPNESTIK
jgi:hypothetical protein